MFRSTKLQMRYRLKHVDRVVYIHNANTLLTGGSDAVDCDNTSSLDTGLVARAGETPSPEQQYVPMYHVVHQYLELAASDLNRLIVMGSILTMTDVQQTLQRWVGQELE